VIRVVQRRLPKGCHMQASNQSRSGLPFAGIRNTHHLSLQIDMVDLHLLDAFPPTRNKKQIPIDSR